MANRKMKYICVKDLYIYVLYRQVFIAMLYLMSQAACGPCWLSLIHSYDARGYSNSCKNNSKSLNHVTCWGLSFNTRQNPWCTKHFLININKIVLLELNFCSGPQETLKDLTFWIFYIFAISFEPPLLLIHFLWLNPTILLFLSVNIEWG